MDAGRVARKIVARERLSEYSCSIDQCDAHSAKRHMCSVFMSLATRMAPLASDVREDGKRKAGLRTEAMQAIEGWLASRSSRAEAGE
jgi:hypothetical protein